MGSHPSPAAPQGQSHLPEDQPGRSSLAILLGARPDMPDRAEYLFFLAASGVVLLVILALVGYAFLAPLRQELYNTILNPVRLRAAVNYFGYWGPLVMILVMTGQVLLMIWPVPMEIASGYLFGMPLGLLYCFLGHTLGSTIAFLLGRWLERKYLNRLLGPEKIKLVRNFLKREGALAGFLIFLIPAIPKDIMCYIFGLTRISLPFFLAATALARLPSTILFTFEGSQAYQGHYAIMLGLLAFYALVALFLYRRRETLYNWLSRWHVEE